MGVVAIASRRRTQEERSASTRGRILDATLECLAELGYAGTTTLVVAEHAGVSRGAQLHHFHTRAALISAAVQHLFTQLRASYAEAFARIHPGSDRIGAAVDLLWDIFQDRRLTAVLELYVAARTDDELRRELVPVAAQHHDNVLRLAQQYFPEAAAANPEFAAVLDVVVDALQGLAVRRLVTPDPRTLAATVAAVKRMAGHAIGGADAWRSATAARRKRTGRRPATKD